MHYRPQSLRIVIFLFANTRSHSRPKVDEARLMRLWISFIRSQENKIHAQIKKILFFYAASSYIKRCEYQVTTH